MTKRPESEADAETGTGFLAEGLSDLAFEIATVAFADLWQGEASDPNDRVHADRSSVTRVIAELIDRGRCEVDDGLVVGIHGLTLRPTRHQFVHAARLHHTWCAFDAIAIPAALEIDATAWTDCPTCQRPLRIDIDAGVPDGRDNLALWLPADTGLHLMESFCADANLFCSVSHLEQHIDTTAHGQIADLDRAADLGRPIWADVTTIDLMRRAE